MAKNIIRARVTLRGTRPLLQHEFGPDAIPLEKGEKTGVAGNDPEEWKRTCMVTPDGFLHLKDVNVFGCIRDASKHTKKGRGSIQPLVVATLLVEESVIPTDRRMPDGEPPRDRAAPVYVSVDGVRNPVTKGRNVRYRLAASKGWGCMFTIQFDKTLVSRDQMRAVLLDAGRLVGIGDGRSVGNGRFEVVSFVELSDAEEENAEGGVGDERPPDRMAPRQKKVRALQGNGEVD